MDANATLADIASRLSQLDTARGELTTLTGRVEDISRQLQRLQGGSGTLEPNSTISGYNVVTPATTPASGTYVGMGEYLLAGAGLVISKPVNTPFLKLAVAGAFANYDYVVASDGSGTHTTLFGASGALEAAIATGASRTIWVCTTHTETRTSEHLMSAFANGQVITVMSAGHYRPTITANFTGSNLIGQTASNAGTGARLVIKGIQFVVQTGGQTCTFYQPRGGIASTIMELVDCNFSGAGAWQYLLDARGGGSQTMTGYIVRNCRGTIVALAQLSTGGAATGSFIMESCEMTMTNLFTRVSDTDFEAGNAVVINDNNLTVTGYGWKFTYSGTVSIEMAGNNILHSSANPFLQLGTTGSSNVQDISITGNTYRGQTAGCNFINFAPTTLTMVNVSVVGNALRGPGSGTAINASGVWTITTSLIMNSYRDWATTVAASVATGTGGDHHTLLNLALDDHTQYLLANGTRALTGNWAAGFSFSISAGKFIIDDANFFLDEVTPAGSFQDGYTTIGGTNQTSGGNESFASQFTLTGGTYTKITAYCSMTPFARDAQCAIYTDSAGVPGTLVAQTNTANVTGTPAWVDFTFASSQVIGAGTYWLAVNSNAAGGFTFTCVRDVGAANTGFRANPDTYSDGFESPWSGGTQNTDKYSIYITGSPLPRPTLQWDTGLDYLEYDRTLNNMSFFVGSVEKARFGSSQNAFAGYARVGSLSAPLNTTAGDLTASRFMVGNTDTTFPNAGTAILVRSALVSTNIPVIDLSVTKTGVANIVPINGLTILVTDNTTSGSNSSPIGVVGAVTNNSTASINVSAAFSAQVTLGANAGAAAALVGYDILSGNMIIPAAGGGTVTLLAGFRMRAPSYGGLAVTTANGMRLENVGGTGVTTSVALEILAQSGSTNNFGIRNADRSVQTKYARFGALTAPSNVTDGDVNAVRLFVGADAAFTAGVTAAEFLGRSRFGGVDTWNDWKNVATIGNITAPAAGDLREYARLNADLAGATNFKTLWAKDENSFESSMTLRGRTFFPFPLTLVTAVASTALPANNTTAFVSHTHVEVPCKINKILYNASGAGNAANVIRITIYSENGTQKYIDVTDAVGVATGERTIDITDTTLTPGNYLILICHSTFSTTATSVSTYTVDTTLTTHIASEPDLGGTLTITAGAAPTTIDPTALTTVAPSGKHPVIKLLGVALGS